MALLHATQLFSGDIVGTTLTTLYTVPAGNRVILREVDIQSHASPAIQVTLAVTGAGTIAVVNLNSEGTSGDRSQLKYWLVLGPGAQLQARVATAQHAGIVASGSIYTI